MGFFGVKKRHPYPLYQSAYGTDRKIERAVELGGTISGEHGVGMTKASYLGMEISKPAIELMRRLKRAFDPQNILNPGKIFPS